MENTYIHALTQEVIYLKYMDVLEKYQIDWVGAELSAKRMGKGLHKVFKAVVN